MNKIFNAKRFGRLFFKHTTEHYKSYLMSLCVLIGVMLLGGSFLVYMVGVPLDKSVQTVFFLMILLLAGTIFTSTIFSDLGDKKKAIAWLMLPASHLEKFLVGWMYSFVIFLALYIGSFYISDLFALNIKHFEGHPAELFNVFEKQFLQMYLLYAFLNGVAICGAVYFEKLHFVKTALVFFISLAGLIFINKILLGIMLGREVEAAPPFGNLRFSENGHLIDIIVSSKQQDNYLALLLLVLAFIFWTAAYYRLKEKQV